MAINLSVILCNETLAESETTTNRFNVGRGIRGSGRKQGIRGGIGTGELVEVGGSKVPLSVGETGEYVRAGGMAVTVAAGS